MAESKKRNNILTVYLKSALTLNIMLIVGGMAMLFSSSDAYGVYAAAICSISALFNCIGLTLLLRWHFTGLFIVGATSLISAVSLSFTCAGWLNYYFGSTGVLAPYVVFAIYLFTMLLLLFVKDRGMTTWQQMDSGFDYIHFRHIYQLSSVVFAIIVTIAILEMPKQPEANVDVDDEISQIIKNVPVERLDATDVTIEEVVSFEKQYNGSVAVDNRDKNITQRIFALKHLLLSGLMPEIHSRENLVNICMVHAGGFSLEQQKILDWYLALDISTQEEWNVCEKAISISDFKSKIEARIK